MNLNLVLLHAHWLHDKAVDLHGQIDKNYRY